MALWDLRRAFTIFLVFRFDLDRPPTTGEWLVIGYSSLPAIIMGREEIYKLAIPIA